MSQAEIPLTSPLKFPPCECGRAICPDGKPTEGESATLTALRQRIQRDIDFRQRYGEGARHYGYRA